MQRLTLGLLIGLLLIFAFVACGGVGNSTDELPIAPSDDIANGDSDDGQPGEPGDLNNEIGHRAPEKPEPLFIEERAEQTIHAIRDQHMELLAQIAHPDYGVLFTPYGHIHPLEDVAFMPSQMTGLMDDPTVHMWGYYDGSGLPIELTFAEYYDQFIYDEDFANPDRMSFNERIGQGNSIDNIDQVFPVASVVEYHFEGFVAEYEGIDWKSLRLVFEQVADGTWYLVAVVHDQWTI